MLLSHKAGRERERDKDKDTDRDGQRQKKSKRTDRKMCLSLFSFTISIPRARQFVESGKMPWMKTFFAAHDVSVRLRTCCLVASPVVAARSLFSLSPSLSPAKMKEQRLVSIVHHYFTVRKGLLSWFLLLFSFLFLFFFPFLFSEEPSSSSSSSSSYSWSYENGLSRSFVWASN